MILPCHRPNAVRALLSGLLTLLLVSPGLAQQGGVENGLRQMPLTQPDQPPYGQRTDAFRRLLFEFRFHPVKSFAELQEEPGKSVLIVLGDPKCLNDRDFPQGVREFVAQGGAVMIASDKATTDQSARHLIQLAGVIVTGEALVCMSSDPNLVYNGFANCPFVQPTASPGSLGGSANVWSTLAELIGAGQRPDLFRDPHPNQPNLRVATNVPSRLAEQGRLPRSGIYRLAQLPPCRIENVSVGPMPPTSPPPRFGPQSPPPRRGGMSRSFARQEAPLFAVGGNVGKGRFLVLADHSLFINRMILPRETGNLEFAANCLHWLRGGVSSLSEAMKVMNSPRGTQALTGERNKLLFWDDGEVRTNFEVPLKSVPIGPPWGAEPAIVAAIDQALARAEDQNSFNRHLLEELADQDWTMNKLGRAVLYLLTFALFLLLGYRFVWRERYRLDVTVPRLARVVAQHEPRASLLEQRRWAMLRAGNVWETAHQSARLCFQSAGISLIGKFPPRISVQGNWWRRWRIARRVGRLWELARGDAPARIPPAALKHWLRDLEELRTALSKGTIRLTDTSERPANTGRTARSNSARCANWPRGCASCGSASSARSARSSSAWPG
jgi:hypothetical protein